MQGRGHVLYYRMNTVVHKKRYCCYEATCLELPLIYSIPRVESAILTTIGSNILCFSISIILMVYDGVIKCVSCSKGCDFD